MWCCLIHYKLMTYRSVTMTYYVVLMLNSGLIISAVSKTNIDYCNPIIISTSDLQIFKNPQYDLYKRCDLSPGKSLDIVFDDAIHSYKCGTYFYETYFKSDDNQYINQLSIPDIGNINMNGIWQCQVTSKFGRSNIYFEIKIKEPIQLIFVNRVALIVENNFETKHVPYNYQNGDAVDVACINRNSRCVGIMSYKTAEGDHNEKYTTMWDVGFQKKLQSKDNGMRIYCNSTCFNYQSSVTVTFFEASNTNRYINVNINDNKVRGVSHWSSQPHTYYINYAYLKTYTLLNIMCDLSTPADSIVNLILSASCYNCEIVDQVKSSSSNKIPLTVKPHQLSKIVLTVKEKNAILETVIIFFTQIPAHVPNNNIHSTKGNLPLVPSGTTPLTSPMTLVPNVTTPPPSTTTSVVQSTTTLPMLTANGQDSEHPDNNSSMILTIVGILVTIVIVFIVIYKLKIRDCRKKKNNENDENVINEDVIPSYPPQWNSEYAAPKDMIQNQIIYAEPCTPDNDPKDFTCEYAILDLKEPTSTGIYRQALNKSLRKKAINGNIGNMPDETNYATIRAGSDHIEPTYSEVCVTK